MFVLSLLWSHHNPAPQKRAMTGSTMNPGIKGDYRVKYEPWRQGSAPGIKYECVATPTALFFARTMV